MTEPMRSAATGVGEGGREGAGAAGMPTIVAAARPWRPLLDRDAGDGRCQRWRERRGLRLANGGRKRGDAG